MLAQRESLNIHILAREGGSFLLSFHTVCLLGERDLSGALDEGRAALPDPPATQQLASELQQGPP